jgi:uncharacterized protein YbjT (DUF2867 family)
MPSINLLPHILDWTRFWSLNCGRSWFRKKDLAAANDKISFSVTRSDGELVSKTVDVLITGGTGYMGTNLIPLLLKRGHSVRVLARAASAARVPAGAAALIGDALEPDVISGVLRSNDTLVHLVGTPHPNPSKAREFQRVDLPSIRASVTAARRVGITHFIYVSVAQPAPFMRAFIAVRTQGEAMIRDAGLTATVLRPWYVLGPGHRWAMVLIPLYKLAELWPATREGAQRLGLVTIGQMVHALVTAIENPAPAGQIHIVDVPAIKRAGENFPKADSKEAAV